MVSLPPSLISLLPRISSSIALLHTLTHQKNKFLLPPSSLPPPTSDIPIPPLPSSLPFPASSSLPPPSADIPPPSLPLPNLEEANANLQDLKRNFRDILFDFFRSYKNDEKIKDNILFPCELINELRKIGHDVAEELGLKHESIGSGRKRRLMIGKLNEEEGIEEEEGKKRGKEEERKKDEGARMNKSKEKEIEGKEEGEFGRDKDEGGMGDGGEPSKMGNEWVDKGGILKNGKRKREQDDNLEEKVIKKIKVEEYDLVPDQIEKVHVMKFKDPKILLKIEPVEMYGSSFISYNIYSSLPLPSSSLPSPLSSSSPFPSTLSPPNLQSPNFPPFNSIPSLPSPSSSLLLTSSQVEISINCRDDLFRTIIKRKKKQIFFSFFCTCLTSNGESSPSHFRFGLPLPRIAKVYFRGENQFNQIPHISPSSVVHPPLSFNTPPSFNQLLSSHNSTYTPPPPSSHPPHSSSSPPTPSSHPPPSLFPSSDPPSSHLPSSHLPSSHLPTSHLSSSQLPPLPPSSYHPPPPPSSHPPPSSLSSHSPSSQFLPLPLPLSSYILSDIPDINSAVSGSSTLLLLNSGHLLQCGLSLDPNSLLPLSSSPFLPFPLNPPTLVLSISVGIDFCAIIDCYLRVHTWGENDFGQLGLDDRIKRATPQKVGLEGVVELKCGLRHVICRRVRKEEERRRREEGGRRREEEEEEEKNKEKEKEEEEEEGEVYVWGERMAAIGERKVLDRFGNVVNYQNLSINQFKPRLLSGVDGAIRVETGGRHNVILTSKDEIYFFGDNEYGQLGLDPIEFRAIAQPVKLNCIIENLLLGNPEEGGRRNKDGGRAEESRRNEEKRSEEKEEEEEEERIGRKEARSKEKEEGMIIEEKEGVEKEGRRVTLSKSIRDIALGLTCTLILSANGKVFILGMDKSSPSCQPHIPRQMNFESKIKEISASGFTWLALDKKGGVYEREGDKLWYLDKFEEGHIVEVKAGLEMSVCLVGV